MNTLKVSNLRDHIFNKLNYQFKSEDLLLTSMTHSSVLNEVNDKSISDNEKLEFIGDSVLDLIVSSFLLSYEEYSIDEGSLTVNRSKIVQTKSLANYARKIKLNEILIISKSAKKGHINNNDSVLSDAFEALIGAIFLDSSYEIVNEVILKEFSNDFLNQLKTDKNTINYKGILNDYLTKEGLLAAYKVVNIKGPDHERIYESELSLDNKYISYGIGKSIKESQQEAAKNVLKILEDENV